MHGTRTHARSVPVTGQGEREQRLASNIPTLQQRKFIHFVTSSVSRGTDALPDVISKRNVTYPKSAASGEEASK
ncbi:hypothetical protein EVAR_13207_1 [Eumeta japonica]|uniref:Uncharacterized protein n=1 Tax=Eumeta variegata TaxID=151549 RepID=A0A4C1TS37_EUMVA|nr:hypothetical protein EVAR_13207_1 [Eumeta japonica]